MAVMSIPMVSVQFKRAYQNYAPGRTYQMTPGYADSLRRMGYAEIVPDVPEVRQAVTPEPVAVERAVAPIKRRRKK
jgi:hypothetical protein